MFARLVFVVALVFLPSLAGADETGRPPPTCTPEDWNEVEAWRDWNSHTPPANRRHWAKEKQRWVDNRDVWRHLETLYIAVTGGRVTTLTDCPFTDSMYFYTYERYDEHGGFHVVRKVFYEDQVIALVMRSTGRLIYIPAMPVWSPDKTRFAYAACSVLSGAEDLAIMKPTAEGIATEMKARIPCGLGDCELDWDGESALTATCLKAGDQGNERKRVRYVRQGEKWVATTTTLR